MEKSNQKRKDEILYMIRAYRQFALIHKRTMSGYHKVYEAVLTDLIRVHGEADLETYKGAEASELEIYGYDPEARN